MRLSAFFKSVRHWLLLLPNILLLFFAILFFLLSASFLLSGSQHICEVLCHFVYLYALALAIICLLALAKRAKIALLVAFCGLLLNLAKLVPDYIPEDTKTKSESAPSEMVKLMEFNCWGPKNKKNEAIHQIAISEGADIVCFCEVEGSQKKTIEKNFKDYKYQSLFPYNCGLGLVSKLPIEKSQIFLAQYQQRPRMLAVVKLKNGKSLSILIVHPTIPLYDNVFAARNKEFELYVQDLKNIAAPKIIVGDLNCTPWSFYFEKLIKDSALKDSEKSFGDQPSWPTHFKLIPILPIDHCLVSPEIKVLDRKIENEAGSDHRPVMVQFAVPN